MAVDMRELKAKLSEYVSRAAKGEEIVVTDRGQQPVARLVGIAGGSMIERGIEEGWITPASRIRLGPAQRFAASRGLADVLAEDRG